MTARWAVSHAKCFFFYIRPEAGDVRSHVLIYWGWFCLFPILTIINFQNIADLHDVYSNFFYDPAGVCFKKNRWPDRLVIKIDKVDLFY